MSTNRIVNTCVVITYQVQFPQASLETSIAVQKDSPHRRRKKISTLSDPASICRADLQAGNTRGSVESIPVVSKKTFKHIWRGSFEAEQLCHWLQMHQIQTNVYI